MEQNSVAVHGVAQPCSTSGCPNAAAFKTRSKPAWCTDCIDKILYEGGLKADEPFKGPGEWLLSTCLNCGVQAHYKLNYTVEKNALQEKTCRACYWREWAKKHRQMSGQLVPARTYSREEIIEHLDNNGFDLVATTVDVNDGDDPVVARCRSCLKLSAQRMGDIGWGCSCTRNVRAATPTSEAAKARNIRSTNPVSVKTAKVLLADSDDPALQWWDHERNDEKTFRTVTLRATRSCHWICPKCRLSFSAKVLDMTAGRHSCPDCLAVRHAEWEAEYKRWKVTPISDVPELAAAWADESDPRTVMVGTGTLRRFRCPAGHHPRISALSFLQSGCPSCRGAETRKNQKNWLAETLPEIASQWHPTRNGKLTPSNVVWDSTRTIWWQAECCGFEWQETPRSRDKYDRLHCPRCRTILGSLAWQDPGLAAEWSPSNPLSAWNVRPNAATAFVPEWICATNPEHVWQSPLASRSNGSECPECKVMGKSKVELAHHAAAMSVFTGVRSGTTLRSANFSRRKSWSADISLIFNEMTVVIEYDGAYWHMPPAKVLVDTSKSEDLLAAGYVVVRLREDDLPPLPVTHQHYGEIRVYSAAPRPAAVIDEVQEWLLGLDEV